MKEVLEKILKNYDYVAERPSLDWPAVNCPPKKIIEFLKAMKTKEGYNFLADLTAIDHYEASPRYEMVYHLFDTEVSHYLRVACPCAGGEDPTTPSVVDLWPTANWHERETYDMFGIEFEGHPDLRRILMWDEYPYFPLRKEFPLAGIEVEFPAADIVEETGLKVNPAPMMGGPFHSGQKGAMSRREPRADDESWNEVKQKDAKQATSDKPRELK